MSLASYIGTNVKIPLSNEDADDLIVVGDCFSDEGIKRAVQVSQFTTPFVYEVSSGWGIEITEYMSEKMLKESKAKLIALCELMHAYIEKGDYFELYSCWVWEESDKRDGEMTLQINHFDIEQIRLPEKTLVRIEKL